MKDRVISRRRFIQCTAAAGAGLAAASGCGASLRKRPLEQRVGLQLYTLRTPMQKDFAGVVRQVGAMGYNAVEFAGYGGMAAPAVKALLDESGLVCCGSHDGYETLSKENLPAAIEFAQTIGNKNIVCPSMPGDIRGRGSDAVRQFAVDLNRIGAAVKAAGLTFSYHNHSFEFERSTTGATIMDIFNDYTDPSLVYYEVDTAWVFAGGADPVDFITMNAKRCKLLHIKDMMDKQGRDQVPVGDGIVPVQKILNAGKAAGSEWYIVELDASKMPVMEAVQLSLKNLRAMLAAT